VRPRATTNFLHGEAPPVKHIAAASPIFFGLDLDFFFLARVHVVLPTVVTATGWVCAVVHIDGEPQEPPLRIDTLDFFVEGHPTTTLKTNCLNIYIFQIKIWKFYLRKKNKKK
jgi:hypothetical protein